MSMPPTPTHSHGHRLTQSSSAAYIEIAATPKRSAIGLTQDRDPSFYRPRSRDGGIPITNIPRRVSDTPPTAGAAPPPSSKSRLPRTSTQYTPSSPRPGLTTAATAPISTLAAPGGRGVGVGGRSESFSSGSYKENSYQSYLQGHAGRIRSGSSVTVASVSSAGAGVATQYSGSPTGSLVGAGAGAGGAGSGGLMPPVLGYGGVSGMGGREVSGASGGSGSTGSGSVGSAAGDGIGGIGGRKRRSRAPSSISNAGSDSRWS